MTFQYRPEWAGTTGGAGVSVFNFRLSGAALTTGPQQIADGVRTFFNGLVGTLPNEVTISFPGEVQELDTVTGQLIGVHSVTPPANVTGTSSSSYAHASGVRVDWHTSSILNGRRLRGRTFIVPAGTNVFDVNGRLTASATSVFQTAANGLISGTENIGAFAVWSRTHGILADVGSASISALGAIMRSRRD